ncbi:unnamed protein product [Brassicogethes aeneus]|uniref:Uncharacterized protein n=1 Tax=Brassicogethes aeneus TaxID=1431903 RepID=A0A9P0FDQ9_BRAAE|nr:unnamed protein product [Brassicogethes aeneus]
MKTVILVISSVIFIKFAVATYCKPGSLFRVDCDICRCSKSGYEYSKKINKNLLIYYFQFQNLKRPSMIPRENQNDIDNFDDYYDLDRKQKTYEKLNDNTEYVDNGELSLENNFRRVWQYNKPRVTW